jgi:hypothetical protein
MMSGSPLVEYSSNTAGRARHPSREIVARCDSLCPQKVGRATLPGMSGPRRRALRRRRREARVDRREAPELTASVTHRRIRRATPFCSHHVTPAREAPATHRRGRTRDELDGAQVHGIPVELQKQRQRHSNPDHRGDRRDQGGHEFRDFATTEQWSTYKIEVISPGLGKPIAATISTPGDRPARVPPTGHCMTVTMARSTGIRCPTTRSSSEWRHIG